MPKKYRPDAFEVAILINEMVRSYSEEQGKGLSRFRLSEKTIRRISLRHALREAFLEELSDELSEFGWLSFRDGAYLCVIQQESVGGWTRLGSRRVAEITLALRRGDHEALDELVAGSEPDSAEPDEE